MDDETYTDIMDRLKTTHDIMRTALHATNDCNYDCNGPLLLACDGLRRIENLVDRSHERHPKK